MVAACVFRRSCLSAKMASHCPMVLLLMLVVVINCVSSAAYPKPAEEEESAESDDELTTTSAREWMTCMTGPTLRVMSQIKVVDLCDMAYVVSGSCWPA